MPGTTETLSGSAALVSSGGLVLVVSATGLIAAFDLSVFGVLGSGLAISFSSLAGCGGAAGASLCLGAPKLVFATSLVAGLFLALTEPPFVCRASSLPVSLLASLFAVVVGAGGVASVVN